MSTYRHNLVVLLVGATIMISLGFRVWWYWPEELQGGPHLDKIERGGRDYSLYIRNGSQLSDIVDLSLFEGYSPSNHFEFRERMENYPSRYVEVDTHHYCVEYICQYGRMQFHSAYHDEEGISEWVEFLPSSLPVDSCLDRSVAITFDVTQDEFRAYIPVKKELTYMTITVKSRKVDRIAGGDYGLHNKADQIIRIECWPRWVDASQPGATQYPDWPVTVDMKDGSVEYGERGDAGLSMIARTSSAGANLALFLLYSPI